MTSCMVDGNGCMGMCVVGGTDACIFVRAKGSCLHTHAFCGKVHGRNGMHGAMFTV